MKKKEGEENNVLNLCIWARAIDTRATEFARDFTISLESVIKNNCQQAVVVVIVAVGW